MKKKKFVEKYKKDFDLYNVCNQFYMGQKIKEKYSEILPSHKDYEDLMSKQEVNKKEYNLPDGNIIEVGNEIYEIPESIFSPEILNVQTKTLPETIVESINNCAISTKKELFNNIILGGGNTCIQGFDQRLKSEIINLKKGNCGIISLDERGYSAWIGASRISTLGNFDGQWIPRTDYFNGRGIMQNDYLFNYSGLYDKKRKQISLDDNINSDELYKKLIMEKI